MRQAPTDIPPQAAFRWRPGRRTLWLALALLVFALQSLLVWLVWRYEVSATQRALEATNLRLVTDLRLRLSRLAQTTQSMSWQRDEGDPSASRLGAGGWSREAAMTLRAFPEARRITRLSPELQALATVETPYGDAPSVPDASSIEGRIACTNAQRLVAPAYSPSFFVARALGVGQEHVLACLPHVSNGRMLGFTLVHVALPLLLAEGIAPADAAAVEIGLVEADDTRLARLPGPPLRGGGVFIARQPLELPGWRAVLRMESVRASPRLLPSALTAAVMGLSLALMAVVGLLVRDTRRRAAADQALGEALAFRKAMEDSLETGMRARDLQGRVTYVNPAFCRMVGWSERDLVGGTPPYPYWLPGQREQHERRLAEVLAGKANRTGFESTWQRRNGETFPVLLIEAPLIDAERRHSGWMSAVVDLSEQRRAEELSRNTQDKLQAASRLAAVGEMASTLSHELNQPLAAIASYANGSLNLATEPNHGQVSADIQFALQRIAEQAERAGRVIRSVQDFVRQRETSRQAVKVEELIEAVLPLVRLQARSVDAQVLLRVEPDLPKVWVDRTMIEQVILNLARNGLQAMSTAAPQAVARPELTIAVRKAEARGWLELSVTDQGVGIDADTATRLFTPFFTTKSDGMGLGLSLCRTVIEQHGGALAFQPGPHHRGTRFVFTLPVATVLPTSTPAATTPITA